jgi:hypothetical protein
MMSLQLTFGKLFSYFKIKIVMFLAFPYFEVGSLIHALSPYSSIFILGRVITGVRAAAIYGGGMTVIQLSVPLSRVSVYLSIFE